MPSGEIWGGNGPAAGALIGLNGGLGLAWFSAVCPLGGRMYANGLLWHAGMAGAACMGLTT
jgi:hypothetical protein